MTVTRDGHGRVKTTDAHLKTGPDGSSGDLVTSNQYQATGEPTSIAQTFPGGGTARLMTYDSLGRMVTNVEPNVGTWNYAYDAEGRLVGTSDARGCGENLFYDLGGRILAADYSPCSPSQPVYSPPSVTPASFPYPGAEESYAYDPMSGFPTQQVDRGRFQVLEYDAAGRLDKITRRMALPASAPAAYGASHVLTLDQHTVDDQPTQWSLHGLALTGGATATQTTTYAIDGRVATIAAAPVSGTLASSITYDPAGRMRSAAYGEVGQSSFRATISPVHATYGYDNNGALTSYALTQNSLNRGTHRRELRTLTNTSLVLDMVGNPVASKDTATMWPPGARAENQTYSYSDDYRLRNVSSATANGSPDTWVNPYAYEQTIGSALYPQPTPEADRFTQLTLAYDWRGNVKTSADQPGAGDFFDRSLGNVVLAPGTDRIAHASPPGYHLLEDNLVATYDGAGNLTEINVTKGTRRGFGVHPVLPRTVYTYGWDELGNLASAERSGPNGEVKETYSYSSGGERTSIERTIDGGEPAYTVTVFDSLVLKDASFGDDYQDDLSTEQVYFAGGLARLFNDPTGTMPAGEPGPTGGVAGNHTFLNLRDPRNSSAFVVDQGTGDAVERTAYMPYGALDSDYRDPAWLSPREDDKFGGHWDNAEVGLVYVGKRYYSPQLGRFISPDPLTIHGLAGDSNPYEYANGNPVRYTDPTGLDAIDPSSIDWSNAITFPDDPITGWNSLAGPPTTSDVGGTSSPDTTPPPAPPPPPEATPPQPSPPPPVTIPAGNLPSVPDIIPWYYYLNYVDPSGLVYATYKNASRALDSTAPTDQRVGSGILAVAAVLPVDDLEVELLTTVEVTPAVPAVVAPSVAADGATAMDTAMIRFTQNKVKGTFSDGTPLQATVDALKGPGGDAVAASISPIRIFEDANGVLKTLDNRRLLTFSEAGRQVPFVWATPAEVAAESWKFTATPQQIGGWFIRVKP